jgi:ParB-like chromosome segregation protein Spo0J
MTSRLVRLGLAEVRCVLCFASGTKLTGHPSFAVGKLRACRRGAGAFSETSGLELSMRGRGKQNRGGAAKGDNRLGQTRGRADSDDRQTQLLALPSYKTRDIRIDKIKVVGERRALDPGAVRQLADSMDGVGLHTPISVRRKNDSTRLVAGLHRLEAAKLLGWQTIPCFVIRGGKTIARLWEIAENLHRAELTALEHDKMVAEWVRLTERYQRISGQKVQKRPRGRPKGGISEAARQLPIKGKSEAARRKTVERAVRVANLTQEAIVAIKAAGLDDRRSALLAVAKEPTPEAQIAKVRAIVQRKQTRQEAAGSRPGGDAPTEPLARPSLTSSADVDIPAGLDRPLLPPREQAISGQLFAAIRRRKVKPGMTDEFAKRVKAGAVPIMERMDGFQSYYLVECADDIIIDVLLFTKKIVPEAIRRTFGPWINEQLAPLLASATEDFNGAVVVTV